MPVFELEHPFSSRHAFEEKKGSSWGLLGGQWENGIFLEQLQARQYQKGQSWP
jgi:hypothetical protein